MIALRSIPYPRTLPDPAVFESFSQEYQSIDVSGVRQQPRYVPLYDHSAPLARLVVAGKYEDAEVVRAELVQSGTFIRHSPVYFRAAQHVLEQEDLPNRSQAFSNWWSLIPYASSVRQGSFRNVTRLIFSSNRVDLPTAIRYAIISAEKGYARRIGPLAIGHITRFADPAFTARFIDEFDRADREFYEKTREISGVFTPSVVRNKDSRKRWWSLAIRTHCNAKRPLVAFELLEAAREHGVRLTRYTYSYVLGELEAKKCTDAATALKAMFKKQILVPAKDLMMRGPPATSPEALPMIDASRTLENNLAISLRMLKRSLLSDHPPSARELAAFFDIYKTHRRGGRAINLLQTRAFRLSRTAFAVVKHAELLHHHHKKEYNHVLYVFTNYFHMVGVPREDVLHLLPTVSDHPSRRRLTRPTPRRPLLSMFKFTTFNTSDKIWPSGYHTSLVWTALVHHCSKRVQLEQLYQKLIDFASRPSYKPISSDPSPPSASTSAEPQSSAATEGHWSETTSPVIAPVEAFDAAHFNAFVDGFCRFQRFDRAYRVIQDMRSFGIQPDFHTMCMLAGRLAKLGDTDEALNMLDQIRQRSVAEQQEGAVGESEKVEGVAVQEGESVEESRKPMSRQQFIEALRKRRRSGPLLAAYTSVLRGFVDRRLLDHARAIEVALGEHLGYVSGSEPQTEEAINWLRRLEGLERERLEAEGLSVEAEITDEEQTAGEPQ